MPRDRKTRSRAKAAKASPPGFDVYDLLLETATAVRTAHDEVGSVRFDLTTLNSSVSSDSIHAVIGEERARRGLFDTRSHPTAEFAARRARKVAIALEHASIAGDHLSDAIQNLDRILGRLHAKGRRRRRVTTGQRARLIDGLRKKDPSDAP